MKVNGRPAILVQDIPIMCAIVTLIQDANINMLTIFIIENIDIFINVMIRTK